MRNRSRYIWLGVIAVIGAILVLGAWNQSPGEDPNNQGGYVIALLFFLILLFIYVPLAMRSIGGWSRHGRAHKSQEELK
jgi:ABC-type transporter Mla subunit MlaD